MTFFEDDSLRCG